MAVIDFITRNYVMIFELVGLIIMLRISAYISERMKRLTLAVIFLIFAETIVFHIELWTQTFETYSVLRPMTTAAIYSIYPVIMIIVMQIAKEERMKTRNFILLLIPEIISSAIYFSSQWTKLVFWFGEENNYHGGAVPKLPYMVFSFYILIFLVQNIVYFRRYSRSNRVAALYIVSGSMLGVVCYVAFDVSNDYSALFTSALVMYYLCLYIHMSSIDHLTSLLNRHSYYQDMKTGEDKITGVISADMNELKYLNDNYGHHAGDEALRVVSRVMWENCGGKGTVYRVGGDEFMILYIGADESEIAASVEKMREKMSMTKYTCAF